MRQRKFKAPQRKTQRRWRVPPALIHGDDVFEGLSVLDELPGESGLVLWQSLRDCMLWGQAPQAERAALFAPGAEPARLAAVLTAGLPAELESPLKAVAHMVGNPEQATEESVSLACRQVSQWADARGLLAVALAFMQAAAVVTPAEAYIAYAVGRLARRRAEHARAETWFRRTIALARQSGDWPTYALAFIGLGNLYVQRGNFPAARRFLIRALRAANRNSLHEIEGMAKHDLFGIAIETGTDAREAGEWARGAYESYGPHHSRLPHLAHDVAYWWVTQGYFARALPVLKLLRSHLREPGDRLAVLGDIGRAAGGVSEVTAFQESWDDAVELFGTSGTEQTASRAYLDFAHGALSLGKWERAEEAAAKALEGATRRNDGKTRLTAEVVLEAARRHQRAQQQTTPVEEAEVARSADELASEFVQTLSV